MPSKGWPGVRLGRGDPQGLRGGSTAFSLLWQPDENYLFYRRTEDDRQDHPSPRADLEAERLAPHRVQQEALMAAEEKGEYSYTQNL